MLYSLRKSICNINYKCGGEKILVTSGMPQTVILTDQMFFPGFCRFYDLLFFFLTVELLVEKRQRLSAAGWYSRYRIFISQNHGLSSAVGWLGAKMASMVIGKCLPEHKSCRNTSVVIQGRQGIFHVCPRYRDNFHKFWSYLPAGGENPI